MNTQVCLLVVSSLFLSTLPVMGQGHYAVLFDGVVPRGDSLKFIAFRTDLERLEVADSVWPGFEFRFNQDGWVSVGIGYHRFRMAGSPRQIVFSWIGDTVGGAYISEESAEVDQLPVTVYVNLPGHRVARPFVGVGAGVYRLAITEARYDYFNLNDWGGPNSPTGPLEPLHEKKFDVVAKAVGGVNVFPQKHLILSFAVGYQNGAALTFGAGVTF
jgi:hypothetical protein